MSTQLFPVQCVDADVESMSRAVSCNGGMRIRGLIKVF